MTGAQDLAVIKDVLWSATKSAHSKYDGLRMFGVGVAVVRDWEGLIKDIVAFDNLITDIGDEFYAKRGIASINSNGVTAPNVPTGMRLGTGSTAVAKNGAGAAIVTYQTGSSIAFDSTYPTITNLGAGLGWQARWQTTWAAGIATASGLAEAVITNETALTNVAGTAANTISRALLSPTVNKGASDSLVVTWDHKFLG